VLHAAFSGARAFAQNSRKLQNAAVWFASFRAGQVDMGFRQSGKIARKQQSRSSELFPAKVFEKNNPGIPREQ
jgi:hypothetical protein